jgi:hypothetical protein
VSRTALTWILAVAFALAPAVASSPARADVTLGPLRVVLETMAPSIPGAQDTLRLRGRVVNSSDDTVDDVSIRLRRSSAPIAARTEIARAAEAGLEAEGREPADVPLPGTSVAVADSLAPGEFAAFNVRVPVSAIGFTDPGSYVIALEALGRIEGVDEFDERHGMLRTFVPWVPPDADVSPVFVAWLWPLAAWPAQTVSGVLLDDQTPEELAPEGRLGQLATLGQRHQATVSWIVDPALLQVAQQMSDGYQVVRDGDVVVGNSDAVAAGWLDQVTTATRLSAVHVLPYADVDASALTRGGMSTDVVRSVTQAPRVTAEALGKQPDGVLYWAPFGRLDQPALDVLASAGVTTVVLAGTSLPASDDTSDSATSPAADTGTTDGAATVAIATDAGSIRGVLTDAGLARVLALPQRTAADVITARQQFLAETATAALTLQEAGITGGTLVASPPSVRWTATASLITPLLRAMRTAPWLRPITLTELLAAPIPDSVRRRAGYGERAREQELDRRYIASLARTNTALATFTSIIDNPTGVTEPFSEALLRASSSAWRTQSGVGAELLDSIRLDLEEQTAQVRVLSQGTITLSGDSGKVPVTIANDLDRSVTVGVMLRSRPGLRLSSEPIEGIRIEAGRMASVDLDARVVGGDPLAVEVQLIGPGGQDYGNPATITLMSTAYARAAAWVVAVAFVAIVIFVIVGVARRIHKAQRAAAERASRP